MSATEPCLWPPEYAAAALLLLKAWDFAQHERRSAWDFAVELDELVRLGLSRADLRRLICRGLLDHAEELSSGANSERHFQTTGRLTLSRYSCFILTPSGQAAALHLTSTSASPSASSLSLRSNSLLQPSGSPSASVERAAPATKNSPGANGEQAVSNANGSSIHRLNNVKPVWDADLNRLTLGDVVVKEYRTPAPNQQLILAAFQEEGWPPRVDDPLPPHPEQDPKRRLHETILSLNRNQKKSVLRFGGDGNGSGVRWSICDKAT